MKIPRDFFQSNESKKSGIFAQTLSTIVFIKSRISTIHYNFPLNNII